MNCLTPIATKPSIVPGESLCWKDSPRAKALLDAISEIIANEFTTTAKEHLEVFTSVKE